MQASPFDQMTVNDYADGTGIASHVDTHSAFAPVLASLSLAGSAVVELRRGGARRGLHLPRRSLLLLSGEARYGWAHYIPTRAADVVLCDEEKVLQEGPPTRVVHRGRRRVSLTFRRLTPPGHRCTCAWPDACDTAQADAAATASDDAADHPPPAAPAQAAPADGAAVPGVEMAHVWDLYERIAPHFSATRVAQWPAVRRFLASLPQRSLLLDAGCGNGKYLSPAAAAGHTVLGCDVAAALLRECAARGHRGDLFRADVAAPRLPLRDGVFDGALCVAVLHHLSSQARRRGCLEALARALRPGGAAIVTAWALEQTDPARTVRRWTAIDETAADAASQEYFVPWHVPLHRPEGGAAARHAAQAGGTDAGEETAMQAAAPVVDAVKGTVVFQRYVHLYAAGELAALARSVPGISVEDEFFDASNWVILLRKTAAE